MYNLVEKTVSVSCLATHIKKGKYKNILINI